MDNCIKCDSKLDGASPSYCRYCMAEYHRLRYSNEKNRKKQIARAMAGAHLSKGILVKQPCCFCGSENAEMHHPDYSKPYDVSWMCRPCHSSFHALENKVLNKVA